MFFPNIPAQLFDIASSFSRTAFEVDSLTLLDTNEYQLRIRAKAENDVAIYVRFVLGTIQVFFGESYAGVTSEYLSWTNRDDVIAKFNVWYEYDVLLGDTDGGYQVTTV
jgi:hypothetical protein